MSQATTFVYAELTPESKLKLEAVLPYKFVQHFGTHITIDWDEDFTLYKIRVDLKNTGLVSVNKNPHITWSAATFVNPYYSNFMLYITEFSNDFKFDPVEIEVQIFAN